MKKKTITFIIFLTAVFITSCQLDIPIKEMVDARTSISRAEQVQAQKYAPGHLKNAQNLLILSHKQSTDEDVKLAKESAIKSKSESELAISKSLPLLADDFYKAASSDLDEAAKLNAEEFDPDNFSKASSFLSDAKKELTDKQYWKSYLISRDASAAARLAADNARSKIPELNARLTSMQAESEKLKSDDKNQDIQAALTNLEKVLKSAESSISEEELKPAVSNLNSAETQLKAIKDLQQKNAITAKLNALKQELEDLKAKRGMDFASEDIEKIGSLINESSDSLTKNDFKLSQEKADLAETELAKAKDKTGAGIADEKLSSAEKLLSSVKADDKDKKFDAEITDVSSQLQAGRESLENKNYTESLKKADEAETALNEISVKIAKARAEAEAQAEAARKAAAAAAENKKGPVPSPSSSEGKVYIVQYHKKNTDCLWRISQKVYKDARLWPRIYMANKKQIKDPDLIFPGQKFIIPPLNKAETKTEDAEIKAKPEKKPSDMNKAEEKPSTDSKADETESASEKNSDSETSGKIPEGIFPDGK